MEIRVCVAGATGWTGQAVTAGLLKAPDLKLVGAVARSKSGDKIGEVAICSSVQEALRAKTDVLVDYTSSEIVKSNCLYALEHGVSVVVGTSGLTENDYNSLETVAQKNQVGLVAAGNFSLTAALAKHFALVAARYLPSCEILDYAHAEKLDVPSGTVRELAEALGKIRPSKLGREIDTLNGPKETRGADVSGTRVHSIRVSGFVVAFETIFGLPDERLTIRHDAGSGASPYVDGTLLAVRRATEIKGLVRGLDNLLFGK